MGHAPPCGVGSPWWSLASYFGRAVRERWPRNADPWPRTNPGCGGLQVVYAPLNQSSSVGQSRGWGIHPVGRGLASPPGRVGCAVSSGTDFTVGTSAVTILNWMARRGAYLREFLGGVLPEIHRAHSSLHERAAPRAGLGGRGSVTPSCSPTASADSSSSQRRGRPVQLARLAVVPSRGVGGYRDSAE
jgi:hypothetical protein